jgi:hypothetical protein
MSNVDEHIHFLRGLFDETSESGEQCNEIADILSRLRADLARVTAERDEARRALCMSEAIDRLHDAHPNEPISRCASIRIANEIAVDRGWDCFDAKEGNP